MQWLFALVAGGLGLIAVIVVVVAAISSGQPLYIVVVLGLLAGFALLFKPVKTKDMRHRR